MQFCQQKEQFSASYEKDKQQPLPACSDLCNEFLKNPLNLFNLYLSFPSLQRLFKTARPDVTRSLYH